MISSHISSEKHISLTFLEDYNSQRRLLKVAVLVDYRTSRYETVNKENPMIEDMRDMRVKTEENHHLK